MREALCNEAVEVVLDYLRSMEARDLGAARKHLEDGAVIEFPGSVRMASLEDVVAWAVKRYRNLTKTLEGCDAMLRKHEVVVYCHGRLDGCWLDGAEFHDVRFIDRFEVRSARIVSQQVWNDLETIRTRALGGEAEPLPVQFETQ